MKKLIDTPEAESYSLDVRQEVVSRAGLQLLFEWRYWMALLPLVIVGFISLGLIERMDIPLLGRIGLTLLIILPGALLWTFVSWRMHRWVLSHRRPALLHAIGVQDPPSCQTKTDDAEHVVGGNGG
jgi:hypothetical protein